jgi:hypothetical protein
VIRNSILSLTLLVLVACSRSHSPIAGSLEDGKEHVARRIHALFREPSRLELSNWEVWSEGSGYVMLVDATAQEGTDVATQRFLANLTYSSGQWLDGNGPKPVERTANLGFLTKLSRGTARRIE